MKRTALLLLILLATSCLFYDNSNGQPADMPVTISPLNDHLYLINCTGGSEMNVSPFGSKLLASVGADGILLVDAAFEATAPLLHDTLKTMGNGKLRFVVNTHYHDDHTNGNRFFRDEAPIIAHRSVMEFYSGSYFHLPGAPSANQPMIGFDDSLTIRFNGEDVRIVHIPNAHTGGDACVHFVNSKIVHVGDLLFPDEIPYVDLPRGGTINGYIASVKYMLDQFPDGVTFVASHGRAYTKNDLPKYEQMLKATAHVVREGAASGKTDSAMINESILAGWASWKGSFPITTLEAWIRTIYRDATQGNGNRTSICDPLTTILASADASAAIGTYRDLKGTHAETYDFGVDQLNMLGYQLLARNRLDDAIAMFKLNCEMFPNNGNVFDSYGESLLAKGDTTQSIQNYEKSLQLDPANSNAVEMLKKIKPRK